MKYAFEIPGIPETKETLEQPLAARFAPWLMVVSSALSFVVLDVQKFISAVKRPGFDGISLYLTVILPLVFLTASWLTANRIKRGDFLFIRLFQILSVLSVLSAIVTIAQSLTHLELTGFAYSSLPRLIIDAYIAWALIRYEQVFRQAHASYAKEAKYSEAQERRAHRVAIYAALVLPVILSLGYSLWMLHEVSSRLVQQAVEQNDLPTYTK